MVTQLGVGEGTTKRRRRNPRENVSDVSIAEASGLTLGPDGYPHPLETTADGELKITDRNIITLLALIQQDMRRIREGLELNGLIADLEEGDEGT